MLLLFETSAGYALFKVLKPKKLDEDNLWEQFTSPEKAGNFIMNYIPYILLLIIYNIILKFSFYGQIKSI
jgi:hypothetical protein